ncbi:MAG: beta-lactamase family protein [Crocinitomicaceae bacterium]|nr:beta-lactamase family protein [Crocinitomicaceae bacterium]
MKVYLKIIIGLFFLIQGCQKDIQIPANTIQAELDRSIEHGFDGIIVYVNQGGNSSFYSAGWKNRQDQIPADPHALFKIASISKLYEAAALAMLVADDQLSLSSTLVELIPEVDGRIAYADQITLQMIVQHRSGIPDFIYHPDFGDSDPDESYMTTLELIYDQSAQFEPDKGYHYSNTNFLLIGEIMDRTLGYSHHDYIKNEILNPHNLFNTYSLYRDADSNDVMSGYYKGYDPDLKSSEYTRPGGAMVASAEDVGMFLRYLIDGTLFTDEEQEIYSSIYEYEHTGWSPGYTSIARYNSDIDAIVVQFVSTGYNALFWSELEGLYERINRILEKEN